MNRSRPALIRFSLHDPLSLALRLALDLTASCTLWIVAAQVLNLSTHLFRS